VVSAVEWSRRQSYVPFYLMLLRQTCLLFCAISLQWASWSLYGGTDLLVAE
jgi:hypothetical protein